MHATIAQSTWDATLGLRFASRAGETVLVDRCHRGPLRVQRPFYPESRRVCHVYLLHPPGGLVGGDRVTVDIQVDAGAWGLVTTPGAAKLYRSNGQPVVQRCYLRVAETGVLEWLPQEAILFDAARADMRTRVDLQAGARFLGWDISCLGRPASGDYLRQCDIRQHFEVWHGDVPLWLERNCYDDNNVAVRAAWGLRNFTVTGSLICTEGDNALVGAVRAAVSVGETALFSVSRVYGGLVCRYLGHHAEEARSCLQTAWQVMRRAVLGSAAAAPRIWNT